MNKANGGRVERLFSFVKMLIGLLEASAIDVVSATTPWLAPVIPASRTYVHAIESLGYSQPVALIAALSVEFIGLAAVSTAVEFWNFNDALLARKEARVQLLKGEDKKRAKDRRVVGAPFQLAAASGAFYITIVLVVNVLLDWGLPLPQVAANVLLSLLSVPAAVIIAIRSQHRRRTAEKTRKTGSGAESGTDRGGQGQSGAESGAVRPRTYAEYARMSAERNGKGPLLAADLLALGVARSSAYDWPKRWQKERGKQNVGE